MSHYFVIFCLGVCEFAPAFVDTPKGDLDSSGSVEGPEDTLIENSEVYPYGTTELFPLMANSDMGLIEQSAHAYAECSNAGICNRTTGVCNCFYGFEGAACQRMTCPGSPVECSGHGVCQTLGRIAAMDYLSSYSMWGKKTIQGCVCDKGFYGGDCSLRRCKIGVDPLYLDDVSTIQVPSYFVAVLTTSDNYDAERGFSEAKAGYFRIKIFDENGDAFLTSPIRAGATCAEVVAAIGAIPRHAIPADKTTCYEKTFADANPLIPSSEWRIKYNALYQYYFTGIKEYEISARPTPTEFGYDNSGAPNKTSDVLLAGNLYFLQFFGNIGGIPHLELNTHLFDGMRSSLQDVNGTVVARAWTNGMQSTTADYFAHNCPGVIVQLKRSEGEGFFWGKNLADLPLYRCLGTSDDDPSNDFSLPQSNLPYDYGTKFTPFFVKLVRTQADERDGGFMAAIYYDEKTDFFAGGGVRDPYVDDDKKGAWRVLNPMYALDNDMGLFDVMASHGRLFALDVRAGAAFNFGSNVIHTYNTSFTADGDMKFDGDITCERFNLAPGESSRNLPCLDKNDKFVLLNPYNSVDNPPFTNLYTVRSIRKLVPEVSLGLLENFAQDFNTSWHVDGNLITRFQITTDINVNWASSSATSSVFHFYKFVPNENYTYNYVTECANRGVCNTFEGTCECFSGYSGQACTEQDSILS
jgi:hypothetical protein